MELNDQGNRLIPPYNSSADEPSDVYRIHDIIPEAEWKAIATAPFKEARGSENIVKLLPHRWSSWLKQHIYLESLRKHEMYGCESTLIRVA
jgi:DNA-directed RNA polymerase I subunit RPA49